MMESLKRPLGRRRFLAAIGALAASQAAPGLAQASSSVAKKTIFGMIGKMTATEGKRDALIAILLEGTQAMPGCLSYVVAKDTAEENAIWITELWDSKESHDASLALPDVKKAIAAGRPMIAGFSLSVKTEPVGGFGIGPVKS